MKQLRGEGTIIRYRKTEIIILKENAQNENEKKKIV